RQLTRHVSGLDRITCFGPNPGELSRGLVANVRVRVGAADLAEHGDVVEARRRGATHARFSVLACERAEHVALVGPEVVDRRRTHRGVRMLPTGLWAEPLENSHADRGTAGLLLSRGVLSL